MGYRAVLEEFIEEQADGKLFVKKKLADHYKFLTYHEVGVRLDHIMRGLLLNGLKPGDTLIFFLETRMEWMLTAQALYRMGGCVATVYATLGDEGIIHVINELGSTHLITSSDLLPKIKNLSHKLLNLKTIIYLEDHLKHKDVSDYGFEGTGKHLIRFTDMEADGRSAPEAVIGRPPKTDDVALIMYTSGSTGVPKGVMALHSNYMAALKSLYTVLPDLNIKPDDMDVCFLPLAHNLEFTKHHMGFATGITTAYSSPLTLTDAGAALAPGIRGDIILIKPASLVIVPLVLDRIRKAVIEKIDKKGKFARLMFDFAIEYKNEWVGRGFRTPIINYLLCRPVRAGLGGNLRGVFCGGALLSPVTQRFTKACMDVTVMQAYGSTETLAVATMMDVFDWSEGMAGAPVFGSKVRLVDWDEGGYHPTDKPRPRGEIVVGGASITAGYLKQADVTADAYRAENGERWFYTGDIGEFYPNGRIKIIDRKKDLLKLALGEYVSLGKVMTSYTCSDGLTSPLNVKQVESELKNCVYVDNICVYGDPLENFVIALIIPNVNAVKSLVQNLQMGSELTDSQVKTQYSDPRVEAEVLKAVVAHGRGVGLHKSEIPQRIKLCPEDWTPENNLLTPGLKIRRRQIQDFYKNDIKRMYQGLDKGSAVDQNGNIIPTSK
jgi:long-chain acyl-CoA synthetase